MKKKFINTIEILICSMYQSGGTIQRIAEYFSCSYTAVRNVLIRNNITRRSSGEHLRNIPILLEGKLFEIIQGHLLGDGCLGKPHRKNCDFSLTSKYYNYIRKVIKDLQLLKPLKIYKYKKVRKNGNNNTYYMMRTKTLILPEFRNKWYINNKKIIPADLKVTPTVCLYWYLDDGELRKRDGEIHLYTQSFTKEDVEKILVPQLQQIIGAKNEEIKVYCFESQNYKPFIQIPRRYTKRFIKYIGECPIDCFKYKWNIRPYKYKTYKYV